MSSKNLLQEYCQKNNISLPIYKTDRSDKTGQDHNPTWKSNVIINKMSFSGIGSTKTKAELIAAQIAYEHITLKTIAKPIIEIVRKQKVKSLEDIDFGAFDKIILVDGENCNVNQIDDANVLIFVAKNTTKNIVFELQSKYDNYYVFISDSVGKDAADHLLTFYAGQLHVLNKNPDAQYFVLTKDHYGEFLEKFMYNCKFICTTDDL